MQQPTKFELVINLNTATANVNHLTARQARTAE
jgi:hypothetical protein